MSCRHDLSLNTCAVCYPGTGTITREEPKEPGLEGPGAVTLEEQSWRDLVGVPLGTLVTVLGKNVPISTLDSWRAGVVTDVGIFHVCVVAQRTASPTMNHRIVWSLRLIDKGQAEGALIDHGKERTLYDAIQQVNDRAAIIMREMYGIVARSDDERRGDVSLRAQLTNLQEKHERLYAQVNSLEFGNGYDK